MTDSTLDPALSLVSQRAAQFERSKSRKTPSPPTKTSGFVASRVQELDDDKDRSSCELVQEQPSDFDNKESMSAAPKFRVNVRGFPAKMEMARCPVSADIGHSTSPSILCLARTNSTLSTYSEATTTAGRAQALPFNGNRRNHIVRSPKNELKGASNSSWHRKTNSSPSFHERLGERLPLLRDFSRGSSAPTQAATRYDVLDMPQRLLASQFARLPYPDSRDSNKAITQQPRGIGQNSSCVRGSVSTYNRNAPSNVQGDRFQPAPMQRSGGTEQMRPESVRSRRDSSKSKISDDIANMITSAMKGRSASSDPSQPSGKSAGLAKTQETFASRPKAPVEPSIDAPSCVTKPLRPLQAGYQKQQHAESKTSAAARPFPSPNKSSSNSSGDGGDTKPVSGEGIDPLDGYRFSPRSSRAPSLSPLPSSAIEPPAPFFASFRGLERQEHGRGHRYYDYSPSPPSSRLRLPSHLLPPPRRRSTTLHELRLPLLDDNDGEDNDDDNRYTIFVRERVVAADHHAPSSAPALAGFRPTRPPAATTPTARQGWYSYPYPYATTTAAPANTAATSIAATGTTDTFTTTTTVTTTDDLSPSHTPSRLLPTANVPVAPHGTPFSRSPEPSLRCAEGAAASVGARDGLRTIWRWWELVGEDDCDEEDDDELSGGLEEKGTKDVRLPRTPVARGTAAPRGRRATIESATDGNVEVGERKLYYNDDFDDDGEEVDGARGRSRRRRRRPRGHLSGGMAAPTAAAVAAEEGKADSTAREGAKNGMQVVIQLEEESPGKVWVEVTPSPKGPGGGGAMARARAKKMGEHARAAADGG